MKKTQYLKEKKVFLEQILNLTALLEEAEGDLEDLEEWWEFHGVDEE